MSAGDRFIPIIVSSSPAQGAFSYGKCRGENSRRKPYEAGMRAPDIIHPA